MHFSVTVWHGFTIAVHAISVFFETNVYFCSAFIDIRTTTSTITITEKSSVTFTIIETFAIHTCGHGWAICDTLQNCKKCQILQSDAHHTRQAVCHGSIILGSKGQKDREVITNLNGSRLCDDLTRWWNYRWRCPHYYYK